jgi:hypothetical protein
MKRDEELEKTIADLIERKYAAPEGSAAHRLAVPSWRACGTPAKRQARSWKTWTR